MTAFDLLRMQTIKDFLTGTERDLQDVKRLLNYMEEVDPERLVLLHADIDTVRQVLSGMKVIIGQLPERLAHGGPV